MSMLNSGNQTATQGNRDPITGAPGSHPIGTGVGAALGGAAAGAAAGTVVGPVGTVIGAAVGAVVGGLAGKSVAESADPTREDSRSMRAWMRGHRPNCFAANAHTRRDASGPKASL